MKQTRREALFRSAAVLGATPLLAGQASGSTAEDEESPAADIDPSVEDVELAVAIDGTPADDVPGTDRRILLTETATIRVTSDDDTDVTIHEVQSDGDGVVSNRSDDRFDLTFDEPGGAEITVEIDVNAVDEPVQRELEMWGVELQSDEEFPHYTFSFGSDVTRAHEVAFANEQWYLERGYLEIEQRHGGLPDTIDLTVFDTDPDSNEGYARRPNEIEIDPTAVVAVRSLLRHELAHLAAYELNAESDGEWNFFFEGHAVYEEGGSVTIPGTTPEKPSQSELLEWGGSVSEYSDAEDFVAAVYAEYGRQTVLDLLRDSQGTAFRSAFERETGEPFDAFYERWLSEGADDPYRSWETLVYKPKFHYVDGTLQLPHERELDWIDVRWDIGDDGEWDHTGRSVEWTPSTAGEHAIGIEFSYDGASVANTQVIEVSAEETGDEDDKSGDDDDDGSGGDDAVVADYAGEDGSIDITGVLDAIDDYSAGEIDISVVLEVIDAYGSGQQPAVAFV